MALKLYSILLLLATFFFESNCVPSNISLREVVKDVFFNPISDEGYWRDPDVYFHTDGFYYLPQYDVNTHQLSLYKSRKLSNLRTAEKTIILYAGTQVNNAEIHFLNGDFYMYFGLTLELLQPNLFVMKANNPQNPMGGWSTPYRLPLPEPPIVGNENDGTVLNYGNGQRYYIWVGMNMSTAKRQMHIATMCNPMLICGDRFILKTIEFPWEEGNSLPSLGGPHVLQNDGMTFLIYTGNNLQRDGVLGIMGIDDLKDPLVYENWWRHDQPIFTSNEAERVFELKTVSFTTSPDGTEPWMIYSALNEYDGPQSSRTIRIHKFTWNEDGTPNLGTAIGIETGLETPSGEL